MYNSLEVHYDYINYNHIKLKYKQYVKLLSYGIQIFTFLYKSHQTTV